MYTPKRNESAEGVCGYDRGVRRRGSRLPSFLLLAALVAGGAAHANDAPEAATAAATGAAQDGPASARRFVDSIREDPELQAFLDATVDGLVAEDPKLAALKVRVALLDLTSEPPALAHVNGHLPVYPASVIKFVYLMAAYRWQERGELSIDKAFDSKLRAMTHHSSNQATRAVVSKLTGTEPGPELPPEEYGTFVRRRMMVKDWLATLGVTDLHAVHPTYDGNGDLFGRDVQFLQDASVEGGLQKGKLKNRLSMTAVGTAELLGLLATGRALSPESTAEVERHMKRRTSVQGYLVRRIAGGAERVGGLEVYAKTGTWGPIYADAGIVRHPDGRQLVVAFFIEGTPRYRGEFIADVTHRAVERLLQ